MSQDHSASGTSKTASSSSKQSATTSASTGQTSTGRSSGPKEGLHNPGHGRGGEQVEKMRQAEQRVYESAQVMDHDLYRLETENCLKNPFPQQEAVSRDALVQKPHCHFFHTIDSNGRPRTFKGEDGKMYYITELQCNHFHLVELEKREEGQPPAVKCVSGPLKWAKKKIATPDGGFKWKRVVRPAGPTNKGFDPETGMDRIMPFDTHKHEVRYIKSNKVHQRQKNSDAAIVQAAIEGKFNQTMSGVVER